MVQKFLQLFARNAFAILVVTLAVMVGVGISSSTFGEFALRSWPLFFVALAGCAVLMMQTMYEFEVQDANTSIK